MSWICTNGCANPEGRPEDHRFYGDARVTCEEEVQSVDYIRCTDCDMEAYWCDFCEYDQYCPDHGGTGNGTPVSTMFSTNVEWVGAKTS